MNNTKILKKDLEKPLVDLIDSLVRYQGDVNLFPSIFDRLSNLEVTDFSNDTKAVVQDLIDGLNNDGKGTTIERIKELEYSSGTVNQQDSKIEGTFDEAFTYDTDGDITKHVATGEQSFTTDYTYSTINGEKSMTGSSEKFQDSKGRDIEVVKRYQYNADMNISGITTITLIDGV